MRNPLISVATILGLAVVLVCGFVPLAANAQATTTPPTTSPYITAPDCPLNEMTGANRTATCPYPNGDIATCTRGASATGLTLTCTNPDKSVTTCQTMAAGENGESSLQCSLKNADGTSGGNTSETTGGGGTVERDADNNYAFSSSGRNCSSGDVGACIRGIPGMLFTGIAFLFLTLAGLILGLAGTVFNWVVIRTVFQFGTYFGTSEGMLTAWGVIRDIANIGLLFGFIFMGVMLILNVDGGGHGHGHGGMSAKKAIPRLIIFAVLLNFSLFASQAVIDVANAFSASFATLAGESCSTKTSTGTASAADQTNEECANVGIAGQVLAVAGLTSLWDTEALDIEQAMSNLVDRPYSYAVSLIMLAIFVLVTAMVLLAGAIMLIVRVVTLSLLMVTSPIGFAGMVIPKLEGLAGMWWSKLISQAFFAPVYLLLIFISIKLTEGLSAGDATLANALIANGGSSVSGNMQVVMVYLIVIGFMIGSLVVASKMGAMGAKFATQSAAAVTVGSVGFVGRRTLGRASVAAGERIRKSSIGKTELGRQLAGVADYGAKSSYSLRNLGGKGTGAMGLDIGKANKVAGHGYHGIEEKAVKERTEYAKSLIGRDATPEEEAAKAEAARRTRVVSGDVAVAENLKRSAEAERDATRSRAESQARTLEALKQRAEEQRTANGSIDAALEREIAEAEQEWQKRNRLQNEAQAVVDAADKKVTDTNQRLTEAKAAQTKVESDVKKATSKKGAQEEYKRDLESRAHSGWIPVGEHGKTISISQRANHHAADKIKGDILEKSDLEKALEKAAKKKAEEDKGDNHGDDHAPAAHAPAPAAGGGHDAHAH